MTQEPTEFTAEENEMFEYLDALRETGITNMFGAPIYLRDTYTNLSGTDAMRVTAKWMRTFNQRHNISESA